MRLEFGWSRPGGYLCDGCNVREPWEHKCLGTQNLRDCVCDECRAADAYMAALETLSTNVDEHQPAAQRSGSETK